MQLVTWNVNSIRTLRQYHPWCDMESWKDVLDGLEADIICLQECKVARQRLDPKEALVDGYHSYFAFSEKQGYSGVATYCRLSSRLPLPIKAFDSLSSCAEHYGLDFACDRALSHIDTSMLPTDCYSFVQQLDREGRAMITDHGAWILFNIYFPHCSVQPNTSISSRSKKNQLETSLTAKEEVVGMLRKMIYSRWIQEMTVELVREQGRHVLVVGDVNVCHQAIDHCDPEQSIRDLGLKNFEDFPPRQWLSEWLVPNGPMVDMFRLLHPESKGQFSHWDMRINARPANYGVRIDYILADSKSTHWFSDCFIQSDMLGSDHAPVFATFSDSVLEHVADRSPDTIPPALCTIHFPEFQTLSRQPKITSFFIRKQSANKTIEHSSSETKDLVRKPNQQQSTSYQVEKDHNSNKNQISVMDNGHLIEKSPAIQDSTINLTKKRAAEWMTDEERGCMEAWSRLPFNKPQPAPMCHHNEPSQERTVTKKGPNKGRVFYMCARPVGPTSSDDKSKESAFRCDFFQWRSQSSQPPKKMVKPPKN